MSEEIIAFINRLYKDLYKDRQVIHQGSGKESDKINNIRKYLEKLETIHEKVSTDRHIDYLKKLYYDKYVIKREDIPESYYKHQLDIALERGYGHIELIEEMKKELQDNIINNQKKSLDTWLDYFLSEDSKVYPFWAKYWAFQGMLRLGKYDKEKGSFNRRSKETVEIFADLNREALAMSIDAITKFMNKETFTDEELESLVKGGSFGKIYTYIINKLKDNSDVIKRNEGKWVKYNRGSNHMPLVKSLQGYNTGWCTAGQSTARTQLNGGDFYVYYTLDENGEYKVPRIAIRMENDSIGEIRGIGENQNIEPEMEKVVEEKLKDFPDKEKYYKKVKDMEMLTEIYRNYQKKIELSKEELRFLYEIDSRIEGFGYEKDPRIEEIINSRNSIKKDLSIIFECRENQIALTKEELKEDTIYYKGDLDLRYLTSAEGLVFPEYIGGRLWLSGLRSAEGLVLPQYIGRSLNLSGLISVEGLVLPQYIGGSLYLRSLRSAKNLVFPKYIGRNLFLENLTSTEGLVLPQYIGGSLDLYSLTSAEGLVLPQYVDGWLDLNSLTNAKGLAFPQYIGGDLYLGSLRSAKDLILPQYVYGSLDLGSLTSAEGLIIPEPLTYTIYMKGFDITPENVEQYRNLDKAEETRHI